MPQHLSPDISLRAEKTLRNAGIVIDPAQGGPIPLHAIFLELGLMHVALPHLSVGVVRQHLIDNGIVVGEIGQEHQKLAGFLLTGGAGGWAFINADDILHRRRFTAAHELGHFVLHRDQMPNGYVGDLSESILETLEANELNQIEREANLFAVELLMPELVCRIRAGSLRQQHGICPRSVLTYRLAAELLVSREAMRYRLKTLELGDE